MSMSYWGVTLLRIMYSVKFVITASPVGCETASGEISHPMCEDARSAGLAANHIPPPPTPRPQKIAAF
ncbi:hypothetical protein Y032_0073g756 [Ancylostoma ceylanicum]|uniref:Secreted protein n=1 Tax=Ancylostoma ceylanicum TaxID=53326 RepID=A0A016TW63_9BILA|nr:hypothetical protein Y032_0073g756 [Ancylostoma ceylanicum]